MLDLIVFFYFPDTLMSDLFTATREQTPLTWLSAVAMLFLGLASLSIYYQGKERIWYFLAITFFFFSLDDATYLHERISGYLHDTQAWLFFFPSYIWVLLYMPLLIFSLGTLIYFLWRGGLQEYRTWAILSLALLGVAILLDLVDGITQKDPSIVFCLKESCHLAALHLMRLIEETLETAALGILGYTLIRERGLADP